MKKIVTPLFLFSLIGICYLANFEVIDFKTSGKIQYSNCRLFTKFELFSYLFVNWQVKFVIMIVLVSVWAGQFW